MRMLSAHVLQLSNILLISMLFNFPAIAQELANTFETDEGYTFNYPANYAAGGGFGTYSITNNAGDAFTFTFGSGVAVDPSLKINSAKDILAQLEVLLGFVKLKVLETNDILLGNTPAIVAQTTGMISDQYYILYTLNDGTGAWIQVISRDNDVKSLLDTGIAIAASTVNATGAIVKEDNKVKLPVVDIENATINLPIGISFIYPEDANLAIPAPDDDTAFDNQITLSSIMTPGTYSVDFTQNSMSDEIEKINKFILRSGGSLADNLTKKMLNVNGSEYKAYVGVIDTIFRVVILREVVPDSVVVVSGHAIGEFKPEELALISERTAFIASSVRLREEFVVEVDNVPTRIESVSCSAETTFYLSEEKPAMALSCPANCVEGFVAGTDVYVGDGALCVAAVHAGVSTIETGGTFIVRRVDGQERYVGSARNGIKSIDFGKYDFSIIFKAVEK